MTDAHGNEEGRGATPGFRFVAGCGEPAVGGMKPAVPWRQGGGGTPGGIGYAPAMRAEF